MSEPDRSMSSKPNTLMCCKAGPLAIEKKSASLPMRIAVVGNHLPRQCGIATFTTDLCDAISVEYGAAGVFVIAVNDPQSRYRYTLGAGKAIISTPYWHAAEVLADGRGALVPFEDPAAIADTAIELLDNDAAREAMRKRAYLYARRMVWDQVAQSYMRVFARACANRVQPARVAFPIQAAEKNAPRQLIHV